VLYYPHLQNVAQMKLKFDRSLIG